MKKILIPSDITRYDISPVHKDKNWFYLENGRYFDVPTNIVLSIVVMIGFASLCVLLCGFYNVFLVGMLIDLSVLFWKKAYLKRIMNFYSEVGNVRIPIQTIQTMINERIVDGTLPHQPTQLYLAMVGLLHTPKDLNLPLQLAQVIVLSTSIASYYQHALGKSYRKILSQREEKKNSIDNDAVDPGIMARFDDALYNFILRIDPMTYSRYQILNIITEIGKMIDIYEGIGYPARYETLTSLEYLIFDLHSEIYRLCQFAKVDIGAHCIDWLEKMDDQDSENIRIIGTVVQNKPIPRLSQYPYNPNTQESLKRFDQVRLNTQCLFAPTSRTWSAPDWNNDLSFEENIQLAIPILGQFMIVARYEHLDAFLWEIPPEYGYGESPERLGEAMLRLLTFLGPCDPSGANSMEENMDRASWQFRFNNERIFVTSFGECYPEDSPRYAFGSKSVWILFQPEYSFSYHEIPSHREPTGIRHKIRANFEKAGRPFRVPVRHDLMGHIYVRPLEEFSKDLISWWTPLNQTT